jgi:sedoheptulose-bisphosphatase
MRGAFLAIVAIALLCHAANALRLNAWHSPHRAAHALRCRAAVAQEVDPDIFEGLGAPPSEWLASHADEDLAVVLEALLASCAQIATKVRTASCDSEACFSPPVSTVSEDEEEEGEMAVDVLANDVLVSKLGATGMVSVISSTSDGIEDQQVSGSGFAVALDPLSGTSILDTNYCVGTMFSIWRGDTLQNVTGRKLVAAGACLYGPRTTAVVALRDMPAVHEFLLLEAAAGAGSDGRWAKSNAFGYMREGRLFSPANFRCSATHEGYAKLIDHWQREEFSLRYTGAAVVDVVQLLIKGCGVFVSPASVGQRAPLRLLYEAIPLSFLVEKAGGTCSDGEQSVMDILVRNTDHRTQLAVGSEAEVRRFDSMVGPSPVQGWLAP